MQVTLYFSKEDEYLIRLVDEKARRERKSRSAVILSILEEYFESDKRLGEILLDLKVLKPQQLQEALEEQKKGEGKLIGEILLEKGYVSEDSLRKALEIQSRFKEIPVA